MIKPQFVHAKIRVRRKSGFTTPAPNRVGNSPEEPARLVGEVQGKPASEPEEWLAQALEEEGAQYIFRYVFGAPKYTPGWKELDFIVIRDLVYLIEVDTPFTHRGKQQKDILHDALALNSPSIQRMGSVYPQVLHVNGNEDLTSKESAINWLRRKI